MLSGLLHPMSPWILPAAARVVASPCWCTAWATQALGVNETLGVHRDSADSHITGTRGIRIGSLT